MLSASLVAWVNCVVFSGIYHVSNGFMFGQFRWLACNKLALLRPVHFLGVLLQPLLPSHVEREETLNTP